MGQQTNPSDSDQSPASLGSRRRHTSSGQSQVRSLYDGLSHLYTDCDSRLRHIPTTNYAEKKKATNETSANETQENRVKSPEVPKSPSPRMSSPEKQLQREQSKASISSELGLMPTNLNFDKKESNKKSKNKNLPAGVNDRDVELFTISQDTAKNFLATQNSKISEQSTSSSSVAPS